MAKVGVGSIVLRVDNLRHQTEILGGCSRLHTPRGAERRLRALAPPRRCLAQPFPRPGPLELHVPPRIHLDLYTDDQAGEVKRLIALGATEVHWSKRPPDADYVILADPEGNRFCVVDTNR